MKSKQTAHEKLLAILEDKAALPLLPVEIIIPERMYEEFADDMDSTGHSHTVWGIPVRSGVVNEILLVFPWKPLQRVIGREKIQARADNLTVIPKVIGAAGFSALWYGRVLWPSLGTIPDLVVLAVAVFIIFLLLDWIAVRLLTHEKQAAQGA